MAQGTPKPLAGIGVLVTRPEGQAEGLCRLIEAAGGEAIRWPLIEIEPMPPDSEGPARLARLENWDWVVFVSSNAVRFGLQHIERGGAHSVWPKVAAIGRATGEELRRRGVAVDLTPKQQFNSEALLALPEFADVSDQRILIVRGEGGRELLSQTFAERGAQVAYAEVYRRVMPQADAGGLLARWRKGEIGIVSATSGEILNNLARLLSDENPDLLTKTPLVVIGERVEQQARMLGCKYVKAAEAGDEAIVDAVIALAASEHGFSNDSNYGDTALVDEERDMTPAADEPAETAASEAFGEDRPEPKAAKKSRVGAWVGYLILVIVLGLAGGGFFILQELRSKQEGLGSGLDKGDKQMQELLHQISGFQTELAALHSQFATLQSQVTTEDSKFEREIGEQGTAFNEKLDLTKTDLSASIEHIQRQMNKTRGDMMVADAEYLLSIANQKLHLVGDVKAVLAAMAAADQRLLDSGDPAVFKVREALAEEINQLEGVKVADVVGLSAKLLALEAKVKEIPMFLPHSDKAKEKHDVKPKSTQPAPEEATGNLLDSTLEDIKDLVTVRRTDRPVQAVLLPEEVEALRQVLLLKLEMARAALLRGDDGLYKANLESAQNWLHEHFDHDAAITKGVVDEIRELQSQQIRVPFPDISQSLTLLRNIEKLRLESEQGQDKTRKKDKAEELDKAEPMPEAQEAPEIPEAPKVPEAGAQP
ncbi:MAG: hemDX [Proteobacteria bacterium]|nr:hemDX [Pseudomonadota bacterium]